MSRTTYVWESTLSTVNLRKSKYKLSISDENLAPKLRCVISVKYTLDFRNLEKEM